jgi:glycosyltransferase involved in cell wall biosynthesis
MPAYLGLADCVVVPSEHETQSLVCLEAQAFGRCLLASDVPGAREIVRDGETGYLFATGDAERLATVLLAAAASPERRAVVGQAARAAVAAYGLPRVADAYEQTLQGLVDA